MNERGYTLLALLAVLIAGALYLGAAMPNYKFEARRLKEDEMVFRGQQIAEAIYRFRRATNRYPTQIEELVEGVSVGTKQFHFLRAHAAKDPLSPDGNWRFVHPGDPVILKWLAAMASSGRIPPPELQQLVAGTVSGSAGSTVDTGPIIGVTSKARGQTIKLHSDIFFGLDSYEDWFFYYVPPQLQQQPNQGNPAGISQPQGGGQQRP